jgi:hypothetical protein
MNLLETVPQPKLHEPRLGECLRIFAHRGGIDKQLLIVPTILVADAAPKVNRLTTFGSGPQLSECRQELFP